MIQVKYGGRLGNNMFQYALGRILAREMGFALSAEAIAHFAPTAETVEGEKHDGPVELLTTQQIDFESIIRNRTPRRVVLEGGFQDTRYYLPYEAEIRRWFPIRQHTDHRCDLVVHVRRTDYLALSWALPFSFYEQAIAAALPDGGKVFIATDDPRDPFFRHFARWNPEYIWADDITTLTLMANAKALVMSQSSFSWWAAFLAPAPQRVICPVTNFGIWSEQAPENTVKLVMPDRFVCIPCTGPYHLQGIEKLYFAMRNPRRIARRRIGIAYRSLSHLFRNSDH